MPSAAPKSLFRKHYYFVAQSAQPLPVKENLSKKTAESSEKEELGKNS